MTFINKLMMTYLFFSLISISTYTTEKTTNAKLKNIQNLCRKSQYKEALRSLGRLPVEEQQLSSAASLKLLCLVALGDKIKMNRLFHSILKNNKHHLQSKDFENMLYYLSADKFIKPKNEKVFFCIEALINSYYANISSKARQSLAIKLLAVYAKTDESKKAKILEKKLFSEKTYSLHVLILYKNLVLSYAKNKFHLPALLTMSKAMVTIIDNHSPQQVMALLQQNKIKEMVPYGGAAYFVNFYVFLKAMRDQPQRRRELMIANGSKLNEETLGRIDHLPKLMHEAVRSWCLNACDFAYYFNKKSKIAVSPLAVAEPKPGTTFKNVTVSVGLSKSRGNSFSVFDYNCDGYDDVIIGSTLWVSRKGRFTRTNLLPKTGATGYITGDLNNDGFDDIVAVGRKGVRVFCNVKGKHFVEKFSKNTFSAFPANTYGNTLVDVNGDGLLDLYVSVYEPPRQLNKGHQDQFYLNKGNFKFKNETASSGFLGSKYVGSGVSSADYDNDGDMDIYVSNYRSHPNLFYKNNGKGLFANVANKVGVAGTGFPIRNFNYYGLSRGCCWGDLDNDGDLDLITASLVHPRNIPRTDYSKIYINQGESSDWKFISLKTSTLLFQETMADVSMADIDNDGDLDIFFTSIYDGYPNVLYQNEGDLSFKRITWKAGVMSFTGNGAVWFDYDNDGDLDLLTADQKAVTLFENNLMSAQNKSQHSWVQFDLVGKGAGQNTSAIGARITLIAGNNKYIREISTSRGNSQQDSHVQHFGLGKYTGKVDVIIRWSANNLQKINGMEINSRHKITGPPKITRQ